MSRWLAAKSTFTIVMATAPIIRKRLLQIFSQEVMPSLFFEKDSGPLLVLAEAPFHFPPGVDVTPLPMKVLAEKKSETNELVHAWPRARVNSTQWPYLVYLCSGQADIRIGITRRMAQAMKAAGQQVESGCLSVSLSAPALLLLPPGVPYSDGSRPHWEHAPQKEHPLILWMHLSPAGTLCHYCTDEDGQHHSEYPLLIQDPLLLHIYGILYDELRNRALHYEKAALTQLQSLLLRLQRRIALDQPVIANTAWSGFSTPARRRPRPARAAPTLRELCKYIQIHLREPLSLSRLASQAHLSPAHLNRLFHAHLGTTAMRYVTRMRMESAREIMHNSPELPVKEVMQLTGYHQLPHFSRAFSQMYGLSPREFRKQQSNKNS